MRQLAAVLAFVMAGASLGTPAITQPLEQGRSVVRSPVLTVDSERLFLESAFGVRVANEVERLGNDLARENREIEAQLASEEQDLTDRRATMAPEDFRPLADAFDARVQDTRQEQAAKGRALNQRLDTERGVFLQAAAPVLERLMIEAGAAVILEKRTVFLSLNSVDITSDAIAELDKTLGEGPSAAPAPDAPVDAQD
ncbi:OmpH family outer membrane protein [Sulfitobacter sp. S190]|uniref:OmpH family outer membrane protein n=1 Tax=Sulfitobacter sp. S190 TaxID=2867022 RepID=UPI0021A7B507|nr:OmpH family outer membrane protein [Sulfitobacter sp. S190]UWR20886.1 OmpH family outer membrane protein [Sulfitobacter sp. S190]